MQGSAAKKKSGDRGETVAAVEGFSGSFLEEVRTGHFVDIRVGQDGSQQTVVGSDAELILDGDCEESAFGAHSRVDDRKMDGAVGKARQGGSQEMTRRVDVAGLDRV
jgi:hypothetical protein